MKRSLALLLAIWILLSFCGCRPSGLHAGSTAATTEATVPVPTREAHIQLEFFLEGMSEYQDATLFIGDSYSLYIPDDSWSVTHESNKTTWTSIYNPDITLTVISNAGATFHQAMDTLFVGCAGIEADGEYVYGHDEAGLSYRTARLIETPEGILAAVWNYTLEAAEGFGARLRVVAGTLQSTN